MKRTWVVIVGAGIGNEFNNCISESEFFGPYTQKQAEALEAKLNAKIAKVQATEREPDEARAMPLMNISPREVMRKVSG